MISALSQNLHRREPASAGFLFMAKSFSKSFYNSAAWNKARVSYAKSVGWMCEECAKRGEHRQGEEVHHIIELTPENISDPAICLGWDNLMLLCHDCHMERHEEERLKKTRKKPRYRIDEQGRVSPLSEE